jgi:hypothetical protein
MSDTGKMFLTNIQEYALSFMQLGWLARASAQVLIYCLHVSSIHYEANMFHDHA